MNASDAGVPAPGVPSSWASAASRASSGMQVLPLRSASASTCSAAARARSGSSGGQPRPRAIRSAIRKPTPNTLVSS